MQKRKKGQEKEREGGEKEERKGRRKKRDKNSFYIHSEIKCMYIHIYHLYKIYVYNTHTNTYICVSDLILIYIYTI